MLGISAHSQSDELARVADIFMMKPVDIAALIDAVHALATGVRQWRASSRSGWR